MNQVKGTVNRVELLGWLGMEPELRFTPNGTATCKLRVATKRPAAGQDENGKRAYETEWVNVEAWEWLAERCNSYLHKGSRVLITGSLRTDAWQDRETGQTRSRMYVRADDVLFLDARQEQQDEAEAVEQTVEDLPF
jgi:single-strand DNA-binding protein